MALPVAGNAILACSESSKPTVCTQYLPEGEVLMHKYYTAICWQQEAVGDTAATAAPLATVPTMTHGTIVEPVEHQCLDHYCMPTLQYVAECHVDSLTSLWQWLSSSVDNWVDSMLGSVACHAVCLAATWSAAALFGLLIQQLSMFLDPA